MTPCILVLVATYNGASWIEQQLLSVLAQRHVDVRVHVFDDSSQDKTVEIARARAAIDGRISVTANVIPSGSAGGNFRRAICSADLREATHVALCDQDDVWAEDKLDAACTMLVQSDSDLYSSSVTAVWPDGKKKQLYQSSQCKSYDYLFEGAGQGCTFVLTSAFFRRVQAFIATYAEDTAVVHYHDWLIYALARTWGNRWVYDRRSHLEYRQHAANDTGARGRLAGVIRRAALIRSGWYARQVVAIMNICAIAAEDPAHIVSVRAKMHSAKNSATARLWWCCCLLIAGRRRLTDRVVLCLSAAIGYV